LLVAEAEREARRAARQASQRQTGETSAAAAPSQAAKPVPQSPVVVMGAEDSRDSAAGEEADEAAKALPQSPVIVLAEPRARSLPQAEAQSDSDDAAAAAGPAGQSETAASEAPALVPPSPLLVNEAKATRETPQEPAKETQLAARVEAVPMAAQLDAGLAAYLARDYRLALAKWLPPAEADHAEAQFYVGGLYRDGSGVAIDLEEAYFWWSLAARQGHGRAGRYLAVLRSEMLPAEVAAAKRRSDDWKPSPR
jgi:hypothetical protein